MQMNGDKIIQIFFSYLQNKTYMHEHKSYSNMHIKYFKIFLPLFVNHQQRGKNTKTNFSPPFCQKQRDQEGVNKSKHLSLYAIYIHEEEDAKLAFLHICIT